jgi:hypothetical protein
VGEHPIGNRAVRAELPSNPKRLIGCASQSTVRGTGGALVYGTIARVTWPAAMKTARQTRSARNKAAHAARIAEARPNPPARTAQIDPLDEEPMRPALRAIPWNKVALTGEQRAAVSQAILDHYPRNEIARALGITVRTLKRLINDDPSLTDAADAAKDQEEAELRDCLMEMARKGDTVAALFLLKSRHGYVDRPDLKAKPDGFQGGVLMVPTAVPIDEWEAACARQQAPYRTRSVEEHMLPDVRTSTDCGDVRMEKVLPGDLPPR